MIRWFVEREKLGINVDNSSQSKARLLSAAELTNLLQDIFPAEEKLSQVGSQFSVSRSRIQFANFVQHCLFGVKVLKLLIVIADIQALVPPHFAFYRRTGTNE